MKLPHPTAPAPSGALSEGSAAWACPRLEAVLTDLNIIMGDDDDAPSLERTVSALAEVIRRMRLAEAHSTAPATPHSPEAVAWTDAMRELDDLRARLASFTPPSPPVAVGQETAAAFLERTGRKILTP